MSGRDIARIIKTMGSIPHGKRKAFIEVASSLTPDGMLGFKVACVFENLAVNFTPKIKLAITMAQSFKNKVPGGKDISLIAQSIGAIITSKGEKVARSVVEDVKNIFASDRNMRAHDIMGHERLIQDQRVRCILKLIKDNAAHYEDQGDAAPAENQTEKSSRAQVYDWFSK